MLKLNNNQSVVTFGELLLRLSTQKNYKFLQNSNMSATFCGAEANVAVSLSYFGLKSKYVTVLPDNDIGMAAIRELNYHRVDTSNILLDGKRIGTYYLENGVSQRPSKVIYDRAYSAFSISKESCYNWNEIFIDAQWFHFSGINLALSTDMLAISIEACKEAKKRGVIISCDLNYRGNLWTKDDANRVMSEIMPYVDVCIGNEDDAESFFGISPIGSDVERGELNKEGYDSVAKLIVERFGCKYVAFTLRTSVSASINKWAGILYDAESGNSVISTEYTIDIVDRVGSGDSFSAALIFSLINNKDNNDAIEFAVASSCLKHTLEGDFNRTTVEDVNHLLRTSGSGRIMR